MLLDKAVKYNIQICLHHEPYKGRTALSVLKDIQYAINKYGNHPAFFKWKEYGNRPLFFVYDSYLTPHTEWSQILAPHGDETIRNTKYDSIFVGLYVDFRDQSLIVQGHFDGAYSYFATDGFTEGSTTRNWKKIQTWASTNNKIFIPSVGPGYDDTRIR
jgi:glycoprotein endo-alpha-1,2-mannosidase